MEFCGFPEGKFFASGTFPVHLLAPKRHCLPLQHYLIPMRQLFRHFLKPSQLHTNNIFRNMSMRQQTPLRRMQREQLSELLLSSNASKVAVIDVRGDDHAGGHIHTSQHVPSSTLDHKIPELVRTLSDKDTVVFHCALSQERGPRAAQRYSRYLREDC